jgi:class 3 adenylate cyclase
MNKVSQENITVMFADVVGSTHLYEQMGDSEAQYTITHALNVVSDVVRRYNGLVIKTAGDDVLCAFKTANDAVQAACVIQDTFTDGHVFEDITVAFHIGIHTGQAIFAQGDIYGDAVNVAARLTTSAKSGQIIISRETMDTLSDDFSAQARQFDKVQVKGREKPVEMYDIIWKHTGDETSLMEVASGVFGGKLLKLKFQSQAINVLPEPQTFVLGRGVDSGLIVSGSMVSRQHACIEFRRDKYVLRDLSTNGTYVRINGEDVFIKREETLLTGAGIISLGKSVDDQANLNIHFECV